MVGLLQESWKPIGKEAAKCVYSSASDNMQILRRLLVAGEVCEKVGIETDAYRLRIVTRFESGGSKNCSAICNKAYEDVVNRYKIENPADKFVNRIF